MGIEQLISGKELASLSHSAAISWVHFGSFSSFANNYAHLITDSVIR